MHLNMIRYLNIIRPVLKNLKLSKKDKDLKRLEKRFKKTLSNFFISFNRFNLATKRKISIRLLTNLLLWSK